MQGLHRSTAALGRNLSIFRDVNRYEQHGPAANQLTSPFEKIVKDSLCGLSARRQLPKAPLEAALAK
jgi:hypothetical protein